LILTGGAGNRKGGIAYIDITYKKMKVVIVD